ncbi:MAG TPA: RagB/SusD family nutrient uptake outer membrane protein [Segetibacter sp.]|jgi:hypothetical protein
MKNIFLLLTVLSIAFGGCKKALDEEVFSDLGANNFYKTAEDAESLLNATYAASHGEESRTANYLLFGEVSTDVLIQRGGSIAILFKPVEDFAWNATHPRLKDLWDQHYSTIYRANVVLDKVPAINMNEARKKILLAEARFLRAFSYSYLYKWFGPVPLITTSEVSINDRPERATSEAMMLFFEKEFTAASADLPAKQTQFGRATSDAATGFLARQYLNEKNWTKAAELSKKIIDNGTYGLFTSPKRTDLFGLANEGNKEMIYVLPLLPQPNLGSNYIALAAPNDYKFQFPGKVNLAADIRIRTDFLKLFETADERRAAFLFEYINTAGQLIKLGVDNVRSYKYPEDPVGINQFSGNDFPLLRFADVVLMRAEALNELQGPNQESVNLVNSIRSAARVSTITLATYPTKELLRNFIIDERGREFHSEALRREDLIRQGRFIQMAKDRTKPAVDYHVLYPIPQSEIDKNPNLKQNAGYQ